MLSKFATAEGSPPLTRGIPIRSTGNRILSRFTPAHAGNTIILTLSLVIPKVHPRSRGEYGFKRRIKSCIGGSPPLTRGILSSHCSTSFSTRFTPAHAGNTLSRSRISWNNWVHPRSRGEYQVLKALRILHLRFTPAHAGNTSTAITVTATSKVHPRSRGEYKSLTSV